MVVWGYGGMWDGGMEGWWYGGMGVWGYGGMWDEGCIIFFDVFMVLIMFYAVRID
jgi:hypothetical protein